MTQIIEVPGSIEGRKILINGLKITPEGRPKRIEDIGVVFPLTIQRDGEGIVKEELVPKKFKIQKTSMLDVDDAISGKILWGFSTVPIKSGQIKKGGSSRTSGHTGQNISILGNCCFLILIHGFRGQPVLAHPKNTLIQ